jgi:hypothetical protein
MELSNITSTLLHGKIPDNTWNFGGPSHAQVVSIRPALGINDIPNFSKRTGQHTVEIGEH